MAVTPRYGAALENFEYRRLRAENAKKAANTAEAEYTTIVSGKAAEEARKAALMTEKPLALDEYGHVLTEAPSYSGLAPGAYMPRKMDAFYLPPVLTPAECGHGEDGIDGKPVPQDLWGLRGALRGAAGLPPVPEKIENQISRGIENDPFPGLNRAGNVERSIFRKQVAEWCPPHRFQERSAATREDIERTELSDVPTYLEKYENAALIAEIKRGIRRRRMRESGGLNDRAESDESAPQMFEDGHADFKATKGHEEVPNTRSILPMGRTSAEGHYEETGVGIVLVEEAPRPREDGAAPPACE